MPWATPSCTAAIPTPPEAPWTRRVSPDRAWALWWRPRYAVPYGTLTPAPWENETVAGREWTMDASQTASSAYPPHIGVVVRTTYTRSPFLNRVTPSPPVSITPAQSLPGT